VPTEPCQLTALEPQAITAPKRLKIAVRPTGSAVWLDIAATK
jgi:hypothetical protein